MQRTGLFSAIAFSLILVPTAGFAQNDNHEIDIYAGALFGDDVTDTAVSGAEPELDDDATFGLRYTYFFTPAWGIEASLGFSPGTVTGVATAPGGEIDMDVYTLDVDGIWTYTPDARAAGYLVFGVGASSADLDAPITGTVNGSPVVIDDGSSTPPSSTTRG